MRPYLLSLCFLTLLACTKDSKKSDDPSTPPVITSINPLHGPKNSNVTIDGSGFSTNAATNLVAFNGKPATVVSATANRLIVMVPVNAGDGTVTVTVNGARVAGSAFRYEAFSVSVFAGTGGPGSTDGTGINAWFTSPVSISADSSGNLYVAEAGNNMIRKITSDAVVSRYAGVVRTQGTADGPRLNASFLYAYSVCNDKAGNVYVGDVDAYNIRKISPDGMVSIYAPNASAPTGLVMGKNGTLYASSVRADRVQKFTTTGERSYIPADVNLFGALWGITLDLNENIIVDDYDRHTIHRIMPDGSISLIAGQLNKPGFKDGKGDSAQFNTPRALAIDKAGNIFVGDQGNNAIRKISPDGMVTTLLTDISHYAVDGGGFFIGPFGICIDKNNILYITNTGENTILKVVFDQ